MMHYQQKKDQGQIDSMLMDSSSFEGYLNHWNIEIIIKISNTFLVINYNRTIIVIVNVQIIKFS